MASSSTKPALTIDLSNAGPPPPHLVFHPPAESDPSSPSSPASPTTHRARTVRFHSRVRIGSGRPRTRSPSLESHPTRASSKTSLASGAPAASPGGSGNGNGNGNSNDTGNERDVESDSDDSSRSVPLRDSRIHTTLPPSPMPLPNAPQPDQHSQTPSPSSQARQTFVLLGPSYGWSEHTPLLSNANSGKRGRSSPRYGSEADLNAELARARAAAKRTEEDVRCSDMSHGWFSLEWWTWKLRRELCCCCDDDDDIYHDYE